MPKNHKLQRCTQGGLQGCGGALLLGQLARQLCDTGLQPGNGFGLIRLESSWTDWV